MMKSVSDDNDLLTSERSFSTYWRHPDDFDIFVECWSYWYMGEKHLGNINAKYLSKSERCTIVGKKVQTLVNTVS